MSTTFNALSYSKRLKESGVTEPQAEIQAEVFKDFSDNLVTLKTEVEKLGWKINVLLSLFGIFISLFGVFGSLVTLIYYLH